MVARQDASPPASQAIPLLDFSRQHEPLREELQTAILEVVASGAFVHGPACRDFEQAIAELCQTRHAIGCASGSDALLLSLMALDIGSGDEVLLPSFTFFATAGAVWRVGATPVFVDIDAQSFNLDPQDVLRKVTPRTKAIIPVHLFGQCAEMKDILSLAEQHDLVVVEDVAQALGARYRGQRAGSLGTTGCFSFYPTKNLGGLGDGGMITTNDALLADQLRALRDHGQRPRYRHGVVGVNSRLDTIQAAALLVKLPHVDQWAVDRKENAQRYEELFQADDRIAAHVTLPKVGKQRDPVWNQYTVRVLGGHRDRLRDDLAGRGIGTAIYYPWPLHLQECFATLDYQPGSLPETERACEQVLSLPIFPGLQAHQQQMVVEAIGEYFAQQGESVSDAAAA